MVIFYHISCIEKKKKGKNESLRGMDTRDMLNEIVGNFLFIFLLYLLLWEYIFSRCHFSILSVLFIDVFLLLW